MRSLAKRHWTFQLEVSMFVLFHDLALIELDPMT